MAVMKPWGDQFEKVDFSKIQSKFEADTKTVERAEGNLKVWKATFDQVLSDLDEVETKEGALDENDPRMTAVKLSAMRLAESKELLKRAQAGETTVN